MSEETKVDEQVLPVCDHSAIDNAITELEDRSKATEKGLAKLEKQNKRLEAELREFRTKALEFGKKIAAQFGDALKFDLILLIGFLCLSSVANATVYFRHEAPEGQSSRIELYADEGEDTQDRCALEMGADGSFTIELGGTDRVTVDSSGNMTVTGVINGTPTTGTTVGTGVTATTTYGQVNKTVLVCNDVSCVVDGTVATGYGGTNLFTFTEGRILVLGVTVNGLVVTVGTGLDAADGGDWAFGSVVTADADLNDATDVDYCPSTSADPINSTNSAALAASAQFDGTTTAKNFCFNMLIDDGDISAVVTNTFDATVTITWINLGDY